MKFMMRPRELDAQIEYLKECVRRCDDDEKEEAAELESELQDLEEMKRARVNYHEAVRCL